MLLTTISANIKSAHIPIRQFNHKSQNSNFIPNILVRRLQQLSINFLENPNAECPKFRMQYHDYLQKRLTIYKNILKEIPEMDPSIKNHYFTQPIQDHQMEITRIKNNIKLLDNPNNILYPWPGNGWWPWPWPGNGWWRW